MKRTPNRGKNLVAGLLSMVVLGLAGCEEQSAVDLPVPEEKPPAGEAESDPSEPVIEKPAVVVDVEPPTTPAPKEEEKLEVKPVPLPTPAPPKEPWTIAHAGFAAHLPRDADFYVDARQLKPVWKWLEESDALESAKKFLSDALDEAEASEEGKESKEVLDLMKEGLRVAPDLFGDEAFVATRGLAWSWKTGMETYIRMYRMVGETLASGLASGDPGAFFNQADEPFSEPMLDELSEWARGQIEEVGGFPQTAVYVGGRVDGARRGELVKWIRDVLALAAKEAELLEAVSFEKSGAQWSGFEFPLSSLDEFNAAPVDVDVELWNELRELVAEWSLVVVCAEVDDYVVIAMGNGEESIELSEGVEGSLASSDGFDVFKGKDASSMVSTFWASKDLVDAMHPGVTYLPFFEGALEGLKGTPLNRGAEMIKALGAFNGHWKARQGGVAHEWSGSLMVAGDIVAETRGGWVSAGIDLETPLKFAKAFSALEKVPFVRAHWKKRADYIEHGHKQVDAGIQFLKLVGDEVLDAATEGAEDDLGGQYQRWKRDLSKGLGDVWSGYREHFSQAFGEESAFVMDLEGAMIPAVGVDEEVVKKGRIPRAAIVRPVVKREALSESWEIWQGALTNMFGILAESLDQPIPFPDTMTAEKDDLRTYFFPFPFASDDFLPSVSVSDDLFILGSSKTLSENLYEASIASKKDEEEAGLWIDINADALWEFCEVWLNVYGERQEAAAEMEKDEVDESGEDIDELLEELKNLQADGKPVPPELLARIAKLRAPNEVPEAGEKLENLQDQLGPNDDPDAKEHEAELDENEVEELLKEEEMLREGPFGPLGFLLQGGPEVDAVRGILDKLRVFRGVRYHRRLEEGVPHSTFRVRLGN